MNLLQNLSSERFFFGTKIDAATIDHLNEQVRAFEQIQKSPLARIDAWYVLDIAAMIALTGPKALPTSAIATNTDEG